MAVYVDDQITMGHGNVAVRMAVAYMHPRERKREGGREREREREREVKESGRKRSIFYTCSTFHARSSTPVS